MSIFKEAIKEMKDNREVRLSGKFVAIPNGMKRLQSIIPGVRKGRYIIVTASSGIKLKNY